MAPSEATILAVHEWNLPLNPEDLAEIAYAVLRHYDSAATWEEIHASVYHQLAEHRRRREEIDAVYRARREVGDGSSGGED